MVKGDELKDEHRTSNSPQASKHLSASGGPNVEWEKMKKQTYDLEERLLEYPVEIIKIVIHKLRISLKELRETQIRTNIPIFTSSIKPLR
jgi:biotin synthase-related radical SAM superfamily protein